jgi:hypothetical protein
MLKKKLCKKHLWFKVVQHDKFSSLILRGKKEEKFKYVYNMVSSSACPMKRKANRK